MQGPNARLRVKTIFHCNAKTFAFGPCIGLDSKREISRWEYMFVSKSANKIRSHARAVTGWVFIPELGASPRPQATGWHPVPG